MNFTTPLSPTAAPWSEDAPWVDDWEPAQPIETTSDGCVDLTVVEKFMDDTDVDDDARAWLMSDDTDDGHSLASGGSDRLAFAIVTFAAAATVILAAYAYLYPSLSTIALVALPALLAAALVLFSFDNQPVPMIDIEHPAAVTGPTRPATSGPIEHF